MSGRTRVYQRMAEGEGNGEPQLPLDGVPSIETGVLLIAMLQAKQRNFMEQQAMQWEQQQL